MALRAVFWARPRYSRPLESVKITCVYCNGELGVNLQRKAYQADEIKLHGGFVEREYDIVHCVT